jgi:hypothetical protein
LSASTTTSRFVRVTSGLYRSENLPPRIKRDNRGLAAAASTLGPGVLIARWSGRTQCASKDSKLGQQGSLTSLSSATRERGLVSRRLLIGPGRLSPAECGSSASVDEHPSDVRAVAGRVDLIS